MAKSKKMPTNPSTPASHHFPHQHPHTVEDDPPTQGESTQPRGRRKSSVPSTSMKHAYPSKKTRVTWGEASTSRHDHTSSSRELHPFLHFGDGEEQALARYSKLSTLTLSPEKMVDEASLDALGVKNQIFELLSNGGFYNLFHLMDLVFEVLTLEVLCTFDVNWKARDGLDVKFRLGGVYRSMNFHRFGLACGCYTNPDDRNIFRIEPKLHQWNADEFWSELCGRRGMKFKASVSKASEMTDPVNRLIHKWLTKSITGRADSDSALSKLDLFSLYCMCRGKKPELGALMASHFNAMTVKTSGHLYGGVYITKLARYFGVQLRGLKSMKMGVLDMQTWKSMHLVYEVRGEFIWHATRTSQGGASSSSHPPPQIPSSEVHLSTSSDEEHTEIPWRDIIQRTDDIRKEQYAQSKILRQMGRGIKWMQQQMVKFFQETSRCFTPPPSLDIPPEPSNAEYFQHFPTVNQEDIHAEVDDDSEEEGGGSPPFNA